MKHKCTECKNPFDTHPYVQHRLQGTFCQRNCWEKWLKANGYKEYNPGNKIRRH